MHLYCPARKLKLGSEHCNVFTRPYKLLFFVKREKLYVKECSGIRGVSGCGGEGGRASQQILNKPPLPLKKESKLVKRGGKE